METVKVKSGTTFNCICQGCGGTGVYKGSHELGGIAVVCFYCNGKGYYEKTTDWYDMYYRDVQTGNIVTYAGDGKYELAEFKNLKRRKDVKYVVYESTLTADEDFYFEQGYTIAHVLPYKLFLKGFLPIPMYKYDCPARFAQHYGGKGFVNGCSFNDFTDCSKFGKKECWNKYYKTLSYTRRQNKLKSIKHKHVDDDCFE